MEELIGLGVRAVKGAGAAVVGIVDAITSGPLTPVGSNVPKQDAEKPTDGSTKPSEDTAP